MRLLAIDTATEACSAALYLGGELIERYEVAGRSHTERLLPMVHGLMAEAGLSFAQLDGIACGVGPGSFAGVRIGVGFVKGLAMALDRPVVGVSSLSMLAQPALAAGATAVLSCIDARMGEVYFGAYTAGADGRAQPLQDERLASPQDVSVPAGHSWAAVGSGWATYEMHLKQSVAAEFSTIDGAALPRAVDALRLALPLFSRGETQSPDGLAPLYLRDQVALTLVEQARSRSSGARNPGNKRRPISG